MDTHRSPAHTIIRRIGQRLCRQPWQTGHAQFPDLTLQARLRPTHGDCRMLLLPQVPQDKATRPQQELGHSHISRAQRPIVRTHHNTNKTIGYHDLSPDRTLRRILMVACPSVALGGNHHLFPRTHGSSHISHLTDHQCLPIPSSTHPICGRPDMLPSWKRLIRQSLPQGAKASLHIHRILLRCRPVPHMPTCSALRPRIGA